MSSGLTVATLSVVERVLARDLLVLDDRTPFAGTRSVKSHVEKLVEVQSQVVSFVVTLLFWTVPHDMVDFAGGVASYQLEMGFVLVV